VKKFDAEMQDLQRRLIEMGDVAHQMVDLACSAIKDRGRDMHEEINQSESQLNQMQMDIDHDAIRLLTLYGPVAGDLRYVLAYTHVTAQLERMGDQAVNIVQALQLMRPEEQTGKLLPDIPQMADLVSEMVDDALDAYVTRNAEKAMATRLRDDVIDALDEQVMKALLTDEVLRQVLSGATNIADAVAQILIARYLERIADQAVNICKQVVYMVQGDDVRHTRPK
jgi:phosphate transport system protein